MPILYRANSIIEEDYPGVPRAVLVDASHGAEWGIFYDQNPGTSEWGASVWEIVGVFSRPEIHVVVRWEAGTLSVKG